LKKAQSALEFLLTYGWVIVAVLTIVGLLAYFGIMNPKTLLTEQCIVSPPLYCMGNAVTNTTHSLIVLGNRVNYWFNLSSENAQLQSECTTIEFCDKSGSNCADSRIISINGELMIKLACDNSDASRVKREFYINYTNPLSGLKEDVKIFIITQVRN